MSTDSTSSLADPHAEAALLGSILIDPYCMATIKDALGAGDFYVKAHQVIYAAMHKISDQGKEIDFVTLCDALEHDGNLDLGAGTNGSGATPGLITHLMAATPTSMHAAYYAEIVLEHSLRRTLVDTASGIVKSAYDPRITATSIMTATRTALDAIELRQPSIGLAHIKDTIAEVIDDAAKHAQAGTTPGVPTGFTMLDLMTGGMQRQDYIILAARPGMGKTTLAVNIGVEAALRTQQPTVIFSLEMSRKQLATRILAGESRIDSSRIRIGSIGEAEWQTLIDAGEKIAQTQLWIDDSANLTPHDIRARALRLLAAQGGLGLVVIDYIQLMTSVGRQENRQQEITTVSRLLKQLAKELNAPVLTLSQLSRKVEERADKHPMLSDLRESGALEQDADGVWFLYRDDYYDENSDRKNITEVIIAKHRNGATGKTDLFFNGQTNTFHSLQIERTELNY